MLRNAKPQPKLLYKETAHLMFLSIVLRVRANKMCLPGIYLIDIHHDFVKASNTRYLPRKGTAKGAEKQAELMYGKLPLQNSNCCTMRWPGLNWKKPVKQNGLLSLWNFWMQTRLQGAPPAYSQLGSKTENWSGFWSSSYCKECLCCEI